MSDQIIAWALTHHRSGQLVDECHMALFRRYLIIGSKGLNGAVTYRIELYSSASEACREAVADTEWFENSGLVVTVFPRALTPKFPNSFRELLDAVRTDPLRQGALRACVEDVLSSGTGLATVP